MKSTRTKRNIMFIQVQDQREEKKLFRLEYDGAPITSNDCRQEQGYHSTSNVVDEEMKRARRRTRTTQTQWGDGYAMSLPSQLHLISSIQLVFILSCVLCVEGFTQLHSSTTRFLPIYSNAAFLSRQPLQNEHPQPFTCEFDCPKSSMRRTTTRLFVKSSIPPESIAISNFDEDADFFLNNNNNSDEFMPMKQQQQQRHQQNNKNIQTTKKHNDPEWKFFDTACIHVQGGNGGDGCVSFRREKGEARGGPNGGRGGNGGTVWIVCDSSINTLAPLRQTVHTRASNGRNGMGKNRDGIYGNDEYIRVPPGTLVRDLLSNKLAGELQHEGEQLCVARGGRGGRGNAAFKTNRLRAPKLCERGEPGVGRWLNVELKLVADVGFLGKPNAGKSTLLKAASNAKPKIANYPFTTITPNLGVCDLIDGSSSKSTKSSGLVLCDIPGLIEGAAEGTGMGIAFLRHVQRCRVLLHVIDGSSEDPIGDYQTIQKELKAYDDVLANKPQVIVLNKMDIPDVRDKSKDLIQALKKESGHSRVLSISAATTENVKELMYRLQKFVDAQEKSLSEDAGAYMSPPAEIDLSIAPLEQDSDDYDILSDPAYPGQWRIEGPYIEQVAKMTHWEYPEAVARFGRQLIALGISDALSQRGAQDGDLVMVGEYDFEFNTGMTNVYIPDYLLEQDAAFMEEEEEEQDMFSTAAVVTSKKKQKGTSYNYENAPYQVMEDDVEELKGFFDDDDGEWDRMMMDMKDDDDDDDDFEFKTKPGDDVWTS